VTLNVTDTNGLTNATSKSLNVVPPQSPKVVFTFSPPAPGVYEQIIFNASGTAANGGSITSYAWDFGNGTKIIVTSSVILQSYQSAGNFTVILNATNTAGLWSVLSETVQVAPISGPTAHFTTSPATPICNRTATFDASSTTLGWNGTINPSIVLYTWNFSDGTPVSTTSNSTIQHVFTQTGNYTVGLTVTDSASRTGQTTQLVQVVNRTLWDLDGDGKITDMRDIAIAAKAFGSHGPNYDYPGEPASPNWNPIADITGPNGVPDGKVDMRDISLVAKHFGQPELPVT
jgi:PKD repeat protein